MGYTNFHDSYVRVARQHNIMALVGNGFDLQALSYLNSRLDTKYASFYEHLKANYFNPDNPILQTMEANMGHRNDWSDIEASLDSLLANGHDPHSLEVALNEMQIQFSTFLDRVITQEIVRDFSNRVRDSRATVNSLSRFMADVGDSAYYQRMSTMKRMDIGDLFNFHFINLNYTSLLDSFVYLDKDQFDPHPYGGSDRHFRFYPNPYGFAHRIGLEQRPMESYIITDVYHPHGAQHTPRSILFGINSASDDTGKRLEKPYWARNSALQRGYFAETHLFIIFGCSLGRSDQWWWENIAAALEGSGPTLDNEQQLPPDLLIYWRRGADEASLTTDDVLRKFAVAAGREGDAEFLRTLTQRAYVILYDDSVIRYWLNLAWR